MLIVKVIGGLGNQMFQYAFGQYLIKQGFVVKYDISDFENYSLRNYRLKEVFDIDLPLAEMNERENIKDSSQFFFPKIRRKLIGKKKSHITEKNFDINKLNKSKDYYLGGYWNNWYYVNCVDKLIRKKFQVVNSLTPKGSILLKEIENTESVGIHFRRGDYVANKKVNKTHGLCGMDYYNRAVNFFIQELTNPVFYIFSDDIKWVKENFKITDYAVKYIENTKDFDDLQLMYSCKHNIIANSTFSWWGAWLNDNPNKRIVAPKRWFRNYKKDKRIQILPEEWIKI